MATDILKVLQEIRGTGAPEAPYTDGIYWDLTQKLHNGNLGKYGDIVAKYDSIIGQANQIAQWHGTAEDLYSSTIAFRDELNILITDVADNVAISEGFITTLQGLYTSSPTAPLDPVSGAMWFDETTQIIKVYNGAEWVNPMNASLLDSNNLSDLTDITVARQNLGLEIGVDVQAYDSTITTTSNAQSLSNKLLNDITNYIGANHIHHPVRNVSGTLIPAGTVVTMQDLQSGANYIEVIPVSSTNAQIALGITQTDLPQNGVGLITNNGTIDSLIDTSAWPIGTILYPNGVGGLSDVKPANGHYQACAIVTKSDSLQGTLVVEFSMPIPIASTTQAGIVQLNDTLTSTSVTEAATANAVKQLEDKKADRTELHSSYLIGTKLVDEANIADGNLIIYDAIADRLIYTDALDFGTI